MIHFGAVLYEQPSEIGMPMAYIDSMTMFADLKATIKSGNQRGFLYKYNSYPFNNFQHS